MKNKVYRHKDFMECVRDFSLYFSPILVNMDKNIEKLGAEAIFEIILEMFYSGYLNIYIDDRNNYAVVKIDEENNMVTTLYEKSNLTTCEDITND